MDFDNYKEKYEVKKIFVSKRDNEFIFKIKFAEIDSVNIDYDMCIVYDIVNKKHSFIIDENFNTKVIVFIFNEYMLSELRKLIVDFEIIKEEYCNILKEIRNNNYSKLEIEDNSSKFIYDFNILLKENVKVNAVASTTTLGGTSLSYIRISKFINDIEICFWDSEDYDAELLKLILNKIKNESKFRIKYLLKTNEKGNLKK